MCNEDDLLHYLGKAEELEEVLRSLASYVGAGGDNAPTVDPKKFESKIRWGINEVLHRGLVIHKELTQLKKALQEMASDCRESAEHLEKEVAAGKLYGDFKHPKAERAEVLAGCAQRLERILTSIAG
jgi:hypothetical protein